MAWGKILGFNSYIRHTQPFCFQIPPTPWPLEILTPFQLLPFQRCIGWINGLFLAPPSLSWQTDFSFHILNCVDHLLSAVITSLTFFIIWCSCRLHSLIVMILEEGVKVSTFLTLGRPLHTIFTSHAELFLCFTKASPAYVLQKAIPDGQSFWGCTGRVGPRIYQGRANRPLLQSRRCAMFMGKGKFLGLEVMRGHRAGTLCVVPWR